MHRPIRKQTDDLFEEYSASTVINCTAEEDKTRQEFAAETNINLTLARFGVGAQPQRQTTFGEVDYGLDLQQAFASVDAARRVHAKIPDSMREKYPTWQALLNGMASGQLARDLESDAARKVGDKPVENNAAPVTAP